MTLFQILDELDKEHEYEVVWLGALFRILPEFKDTKVLDKTDAEKLYFASVACMQFFWEEEPRTIFQKMGVAESDQREVLKEIYNALDLLRRFLEKEFDCELPSPKFQKPDVH
jgi:hypothetical protein